MPGRGRPCSIFPATKAHQQPSSPPPDHPPARRAVQVSDAVAPRRLSARVPRHVPGAVDELPEGELPSGREFFERYAPGASMSGKPLVRASSLHCSALVLAPFSK